MNDFAKAIQELIKSAQDDRPNSVVGHVTGVRTGADGLSIYKVQGTHPGRAEIIETESVVPITLSASLPALSVGSVVVLDIPQGQVGFAKIIAVTGILPAESEKIAKTKDTSPTPAVVAAKPDGAGVMDFMTRLFDGGSGILGAGTK